MNYIERYWRDATPQDAIKDPPMVARFTYENWKECMVSNLIYWDRSQIPWHDDDGNAYKHCQVYDAPDPGEGWRLVDVDSEKPQKGDEFLLTPRNEWITIAGAPNKGFVGRGFAEGYIYRRRIEPPKPKYEPFHWEDREQLRGRWIRREEDSGVTLEMPIEKLESDGCELFLINGYTAKQMLDSWRFLDTGEPVGKKVVQ